MHFSIDRTVHTTAFDKPVVDHWLERKIANDAAAAAAADDDDNDDDDNNNNNDDDDDDNNNNK